MAYAMYVTCRTEEQAERLRRAGYHVTIVPSNSPPRQSAPRAPARQDSAKSYAYALADLKASVDGRRLGRQFAHDACVLARHLGITVQYVPLAQLQHGDRPLITITGGLWRIPGQPPVAQLADTLDGREAAMILAHEIGHFLDFPDERLCDQFAAAFLRPDDSDTPAARWKAMDDECIRHARR
ncbi:unnamed protein product, partial [marine sediment metagenome]